MYGIVIYVILVHKDIGCPEPVYNTTTTFRIVPMSSTSIKQSHEVSEVMRYVHLI